MRLLGRAVLISLVLHALLLLALPAFKEAQRGNPVRLTARLAAPKPPEPVAPRVETPPPQPVLPAPAVRPPPIARAAPQPVVPAAPARSVELSEQAIERAFALRAAPAAPPPAAQPSPAARPEFQSAVQSPGAPEADTILQFRLELMDLARRYKRYPRVAQENNWEGRVALRIAIGENGAISSLTVTKGSGRAVLDEEAQAMIRTAKSKAAIPPVLRGKAFVLEIPVDFSLKD